MASPLFELVQKLILPRNCRSSGKFVLNSPFIYISKSYENHRLLPTYADIRLISHTIPRITPQNTPAMILPLSGNLAATSGNIAARAAIWRQLLTPRIAHPHITLNTDALQGLELRNPHRVEVLPVPYSSPTRPVWRCHFAIPRALAD